MKEIMSPEQLIDHMKQKGIKFSIAKYDKTDKKAYLEFPDGRREYAE